MRKLKYYFGRPTCVISGCSELSHMINCKNGKYTWRKYCGKHHKSRGLLFNKMLVDGPILVPPECEAPACNETVSLLGLDEDNSFKYATYCTRHSSTPYHLGFRKDHCENIDSRLGFKCTTNIFWIGMLQVDHIDGDPYNNQPDGTNYQTLCGCCHAYKTWKNKDYLTPGRKGGREISLQPIIIDGYENEETAEKTSTFGGTKRGVTGTISENEGKPQTRRI